MGLDFGPGIIIYNEEEEKWQESMRGMKRSHRCTEVSKANIGEIVTVMGWVQKRRNLGNLIFIDLRDRSGILQIVFDSNDVSEAGMEKAATLRSEFVVAVTGKVIARAGAVNENLATGDIEVQAHELRILSGVRDTAVPHRGEHSDQGRATSEIPLPGSAPSEPAAQPDAAEQGGNRGSEIPGRRGIPGDRDPHPD